jgi:hypothetical protein
MRISVKWEECGKGGAWCNLSGIYLDSPSFTENGRDVKGVYIIWSEKESRVVRVGSGELKIRIKDHQSEDWAKKDASLKVTFVQIDDENVMKGVETYLGYVYDPVEIGERYPNIRPVGVNLPKNGVFVNTYQHPQEGESDYELKWSLFNTKYMEWAVSRGREI